MSLTKKTFVKVLRNKFINRVAKESKKHCFTIEMD